MKFEKILVFAAIACGVQFTKDVEARISFQKFEVFLNTDYPVDHMELDKYYDNCTHLLVGSWPHLFTTNGYSSSILSTLIFATGFTQVNKTHIVLVDHDAHCVRILNRKDNVPHILAGTCGSSGFSDGGFGEGTFNYPYGVVVDKRNPERILVTDMYNHALRSVDLNTRILRTVYKIRFSGPQGLIWVGDILLVANYHHYITKIWWNKAGGVRSNKWIGSTTAGDRDGGFNIAKFQSLHEMTNFRSKLYLVTDYGNKKLKLLDLRKQVVDPVCFKGEDFCSSSSLFPSGPLSILNIKEEVYVGTENTIYKLSLSNLRCPYKNISATLAPGETTAKVKLLDGYFVDFPEGVYKMKKMYNLEMCVYHVVVKRSEPKHHDSWFNLDPECAYKNITSFRSPHLLSVAVNVTISGKSVWRGFPEGVFRMAEEYNSKTCIYHVHVETPLKQKRLSFKADYEASCDAVDFNDYSRLMLRSILKQRKQQLQSICAQNCELPVKIDPFYNCTNDVLTIHWPTDKLYPATTSLPPADLTNQLNQRLAQSAILKSLELYIPFNLPPLISAKKNSEEKMIQLVLLPTCADESDAAQMNICHS